MEERLKLLYRFLLLLLLVSAVLVIVTSHRSRQYFGAREEARQELNELQTEWGRLLLEESVLSSHAVVERVAIEKLKMIEVNDDNMKVLEVYE